MGAGRSEQRNGGSGAERAAHGDAQISKQITLVRTNSRKQVSRTSPASIDLTTATSGRRPAGALVQGPGVIAAKRVASHSLKGSVNATSPSR